MRDALAVIGALCMGCTFVIIVLAILASTRDRTERRARERQQIDRDATDHIRRFSAAMAVLDLDAYRARKANAPATRSRSPHDALAGRLESQPGAESLPNNPLEFKHHA